jgi:flavin-dependent dehydrogenase
VSKSPVTPEQVDVVVVGSRPAGTATSIPLALAGRKVLVIDRASFPSDTVSTHCIFPGGLYEMKLLGALDRVEACGAPKMPFLEFGADGERFRGTFTPLGGIDYCLCPRRIQMDLALVETAREAGVEVRERCKLVDLVRDGDRVVGIRYDDAQGERHEVRAKLVVGADGRDSTVAGLVGSGTPYRRSRPGRGMAFYYVKDKAAVASGDPTLRNALSAWRVGDNIGYFFPTNGDGGVALFMPPVAEIPRMRKDTAQRWAEMVESHPIVRERLAGTELDGRIRLADDTDGYFRVSSGPGWALTGDAGSFKDPVIAQGIRDALHYGRVLGEMVVDVLDDPNALDRRLRAFERKRDLGVVRQFYWAVKFTRAESTNAVELEYFRAAMASTGAAGLLVDMFGRTKSPQRAFTLRRSAVWTLRALRRPGADRGAVLRAARADLAIDAQMYRDLIRLCLGARVRPDKPEAVAAPASSRQVQVATSAAK